MAIACANVLGLYCLFHCGNDPTVLFFGLGEGEGGKHNRARINLCVNVITVAYNYIILFQGPRGRGGGDSHIRARLIPCVNVIGLHCLF